MHHPDIDAVERQVLDDHLGIALGHAATGLAVPRDGPALEPGRVQAPEDPSAPFDQRLDLEVLFPDAPVPQVLGQARDKEVRRFQDVPVGGDDKGLVRHVLSFGPDLGRPRRAKLELRD